MGLSKEDLLWLLIMLVFFLLLLFVFIFLGIIAFSKPGGFNAVVNSILPMASGAGLAQKKADIQSAIDKMKGWVQKVIKTLKKK